MHSCAPLVYRLILVLIMAAPASAGAAPVHVATAPIAIVHATVIPMDREAVLKDQTVVVAEGVIAAVGPANATPVPEGACTVDARGRYLIPGLADMHVHLCDETDLGEFLRHGVTTVRNMADYPWLPRVMGFPRVAALRARVTAGRLRGPRIVTSGPALDGRPPVSPFNEVVDNPEEGRKAVRQQKAAGVDFIKIYDGLTGPTLAAVLDEAKAAGLPVAGHVPKAVSMDNLAGTAAVSIEHNTGFFDNDAERLRVPEEEFLVRARRLREAGLWSCPTLVIYDGLVPPARLHELRARPGFRRLPWQLKWLWRMTLKRVYRASREPDTYAARMMTMTIGATRALIREGAPLVTGTDANFAGVFPGDSLHREMELLVAAGLTPLAALKAATAAPAELLRETGTFGTVTPGSRADLVLLREDPLADIRNTRSIDRVMLRGVWEVEAGTN